MFTRILLLIAGLVLLTEPAWACSCANSAFTKFEEGCPTSNRVFGGTFGSTDWPLEYQFEAIIQLNVDVVWKGDVPPTAVGITDFGCCTCQINGSFRPGERFVICDDGQVDEVAYFHMCNPPLTGEHEKEMASRLGPGKPPTPPSLHRLATQALAGLVLRASRQAWLLLPILSTLLASLIGWIHRRRLPLPPCPPRWKNLLVALFAIGVAMVALRVSLVTMPERVFQLTTHPFGVLLAVASCAGATVGFLGQRRPERFGRPARALLAAGASVFVLLLAGFMPAHLPVQLPGAAECSKARAWAFLAGLPEKPRFEWEWDDWRTTVRKAAEDLPRGCVDLGLSKLRLDEHWDTNWEIACIKYADGQGGMRLLCREGQEVLDEGFIWLDWPR